LRDPERARKAVAEAHERLGRLDVFIHAVGMNDRRPILDYSDDDWRTFMDVNLNSAFWLGQAAGKIMCEQGSGRQIYFSSVAGSPRTNITARTRKQGRHHQMMRVMANEWATSGVTVNALAPATSKRRSLRSISRSPASGPRSKRSFRPAGSASSRRCRPALFLASRHAAFVTGHILYVDAAGR